MRFARHLTDEVKVEKYAGRSASKPGAPEWTDLGLYNGKLLERGTISYDPAGNQQVWDATVIVQAPQAFSDRNGRYRVTVSELYGAREAESLGLVTPTVKRTRVLEVQAVEVHEDEDGNDFLQVLRCANGRA